jgi:YD repeat-containing protein
VNTYNARDQVTLVRQFQGTDQSGVYQDTAMSYDGYGRLQTTHVPEQDANTATVWNYNPDDTVSSVTDASGALQTFSYNNRHLVTGVAYSAPSGITPAAPASFAYDAAGNRTSMTDGLGSTTYHHDQLSRMDSETRVFNGFGSYSITYAYNLANELTSITDPFGAQVGYTRDIAGRISAMTGSGFADVTSYASDFQYRASGALKHVKYGNGSLVDATYNARLQPASFTAQYGISISYERFADGRVKYSHELGDPRYDRSYSYDRAGQLTQALSGAEARGEAATNDRPYKQDMTFDVWGNMTSRTAKHWSRNLTPFGGTYVNNPMNGWQYDADGRNTVSNSVTSKFDAAGRLVQANGPQRRNNPPLVLTQEFDGDGQRAKKTEYSQTTYLLRSSVMGGAVLTEIRGTPNPYFGQKQKTHVYADGSELAEQNPAYGHALYRAIDPSGVEQMGTVAYQLDPLGNDVGDEDPYLAQNYPEFSYPTSGDVADLGGDCASRPGIPMNCSAKGSYIRRLLGFVLPQLTRFRPGLGYPGTPPTFPNSQTTLGSIFKDATEGTVLGELLYPKINWMWIQPIVPWGSLFANPQNPSEPQGTFDAAYQSCLGSLGNSTAPGLAQAADILMVANRTGVDPALLSVTWRFEGGLDQHGQFNFQPTNGMHTPSTQTGDIGPGQLYPDTWNRSPYTGGLSNPFGTNLNRGQVFNGNAFENLMVAGRALGQLKMRNARTRLDFTAQAAAPILVTRRECKTLKTTRGTTTPSMAVSPRKAFHHDWSNSYDKVQPNHIGRLWLSGHCIYCNCLRWKQRVSNCQ